MDLDKNWQRCHSHTFWKEEASCSHVVQIYENDTEFLNLLEGFVSGGFSAGEAVILIATRSHLDTLEKNLKQSGTDLEAMKANGQYLPFDADEMLGMFMVNDWPDYSLFMVTISEAFGKARKDGRPVRAFGEMVALLWAQGNSGATIMVEQLWNMYCEKEPFALFCAYPKSEFPDNSMVSLKHICKTHSKMIAGCENSTTELSYVNVNQ
jgi:hypothetical protein